MPQKAYYEYIIRIYQTPKGNELVKAIMESTETKDCHLIGASQLSLGQIKYAKDLQLNTEIGDVINEMDRFM